MSDILPEPLVPAEVDLRDFSFTPMFRARLFGSTFHARTTDSEWRAGVTLWLKSWDQVPAGTLPDDDIDLCRLAEFGRDIKSWKKVRDGALHGWVKCSDRRLHHRVVAEGVLEAWQRRSGAIRKGKAGAQKRWDTGNASAITGDSTGNASAITGDSTGIAQAIARAMLGDSNRQGQGQGEGERARDARDPPAAVVNGQAGRSTKLPPDFVVPDTWIVEAERQRHELGLGAANLRLEARTFVNYHTTRPEAAHSFNWQRNWLSWALKAKPDASAAGAARRKNVGPL